MHKSFCSYRLFWLFGRLWIAGLFLGFALSFTASDETLSWMRLSAGCRVSIVLVFVWCSFPLLISAIAVMIHNFKLLFFCTFLRCLLYGFYLGIGAAAFGAAAWLVQPFLQLTDNLSLIVFCSYCIYGISSRRANLRFVGICILIIYLSAVIDYYAVSDFLSGLLHF